MSWIKQILRFIIVMILQLLVLNRLQVLGVCHPMVYVLCLFMLPISLPSQVDIVIGALVGLIVDSFCNSPGVHMAACALVMYLRRHMVKSLVAEPERLKGDLDIRNLGTEAFLKYMTVLVLVHHFVVFLLNAWSWSMAGWVLLETLVSALVTVFLVLAYNMAKE